MTGVQSGELPWPPALHAQPDCLHFSTCSYAYRQGRAAKHCETLCSNAREKRMQRRLLPGFQYRAPAPTSSVNSYKPETEHLPR